MEVRLVTDRSIGSRLTLQHWIASFIFIEVVWTFVGGGVTYAFMKLSQTFAGPSAIWTLYVAQHLSFVVLLATLLIFIRVVVRTTFLSFVTNAPKFRWRITGFAFSVWFVGMILITGFRVLFDSNAIMVNPTNHLGSRLSLMLLALFLTPLQCIAEELLFRTTLWRMLEGKGKHVWLPAVISGLIFTLAHLTNVEVQSSNYHIFILAYYFLSGVFFMEMTRVYGGSEAAFGAHVANNLFLVLVVTYNDSSLASDPFLILENPLVILDMVVLIVCSTIIIRQADKIKG